MVTPTRQAAEQPLPSPSQRPTWHHAAGGLSVLALAAATAEMLLPAVPNPVGLPRWTAVGAAGLGVATWAAVALWSARPSTAEGPLPRTLAVAAWTTCVALLVVSVGIAFDIVGTVMWAGTVITGQGGVVALPVDPAGSVTRVLALAGGVTWGATARAARRRAPGAEASGSATLRLLARRVGYLAAVLPVGYGGLKVYWGLGGDVGLSPAGAQGEVALWTPGIGDTAVLAAVGIVLALALLRPWGQRLPRWLPLAGAYVGCAMLIPVGLLAIATTLPDVLAGGSSGPISPWVAIVIYPWFLAWGLALATAAWSFAYRTSPVRRS